MSKLSIKELVEMIWNNPKVTSMIPTQMLGILNDNAGHFSNMLLAVSGMRWSIFKELILSFETLEEAKKHIDIVCGLNTFIKYKENKTVTLPDDDMDLGVYFIWDTRGIKIGVTNQINKRLKQLQTGNPMELELLKFIKTPDAYELETRFHNLLEGKRLTGEWFDITPEDVELFI